MATQGVTGIVPAEESAINDEPHIEGSRITVRYVQRRVEREREARLETAEEYTTLTPPEGA